MKQKTTIRMLVVEDNPGYLYLLSMAFRKRETVQWELTVAESGEQAVELLFDEEQSKARLPDLVLLDWNLPKLSGSDVLKRIKSHQKLRRIPVLVFSTSESETDIADAYDNHANGYITKPRDLDVLAAIVETIERFWIALATLPNVLQ